MLIRLSSRGRIIVPKALREQLHWKAGDWVVVRDADGKIVLEKLPQDKVSELHGKLAGYDYIKDLEEEHRREIEKDKLRWNE